jgi:MFS family permease
MLAGRINRPWLLTAAVALMAVAHIVLVIPGTTALCLGACLGGLSYGCSWTLTPSILSDIFGLKVREKAPSAIIDRGLYNY